MPPVKIQSPCGGCWAFTATTSVEYQTCLKNGNNTPIILRYDIVTVIRSLAMKLFIQSTLFPQFKANNSLLTVAVVLATKAATVASTLTRGIISWLLVNTKILHVNISDIQINRDRFYSGGQATNVTYPYKGAVCNFMTNI